MTTKIKWRLGDLPTPDELRALVNDNLVTKEEAREILFSTETVEDRDKKSLEAEIKFLRELVETLSKNSQRSIVETIRYVEKPYYAQPWYRPYAIWCATAQGVSGSTIAGSNSLVNVTTTGTLTSGGAIPQAFSKINTF